MEQPVRRKRSQRSGIVAVAGGGRDVRVGGREDAMTPSEEEEGM